MSVELNSVLEPGMLVRNPEQKDWGLGQVQSNIKGKITVNFEEVGKLTLNAAEVILEIVYDQS